MTATIRHAIVADAPAMGRLHVGARRFYEIAGWACDGTERTVELQGVVVPEVRYRRRSTSEESSSATPEGTE